MALTVSTDGVGQSVGGASFSGSYDGAGGFDFAEVYFEWGYAGFDHFDGHVNVTGGGSGSYGTSVGIDRKDTDAKVRARGVTTGPSSTPQGVSINFKTFADGAFIGTPILVSTTNNSFTVSGSYNPNTITSSSGVSAHWRVQGSGSAFAEILIQSYGPGSGGSFQTIIGGLVPGLAYEFFFRGVRTTSNDQLLDSPHIFVSMVPPPTVTTGVASAISATSAIIDGTINPNAAAGSVLYFFQYGPTTEYGTNTPTQGPISGVDPISVQAEIAGLLGSATYHFRLVAQIGSSFFVGGDAIFFTGLSDPVLGFI